VSSDLIGAWPWAPSQSCPLSWPAGAISLKNEEAAVTTSGGFDGVNRVIVGVDTHLDEHVAVGIDHHGARLGEYRLATTAKVH
jgi:hypothetical protein